MNEDWRHTAQLFVGSLYGAAIIAAVIWLAIHAVSDGERNLLLGILGGGFGGAVSMFLGNMPSQRRGTGTGAGPTVNVDSPQVDVTATAGAVRTNKLDDGA